MLNLKRTLCILIGLIVFGSVWRWTQAPRQARPGVDVTLELETPMSDRFELFYDTIAHGYGGQWSVSAEVQAAVGRQEVVFHLPTLGTLHGLRIDPGEHRNTLSISRLRIDGPYNSVTWMADDILRHFTRSNDIDTLRVDHEERSVIVTCTGSDPFMATESSLARELEPVLTPRRQVLLPFVLAALSAVLVGWLLGLLLSWDPPRMSLRGVKPTAPWYGYLLLLTCTLVVFLLVRALLNGIQIKTHTASIVVSATLNKDDDSQLFHATSQGAFTKDDHIPRRVSGHSKGQLLIYRLPAASDPRYIRFDPGMYQDTVRIDSLTLMVDEAFLTFSADSLGSLFEPSAHVRSLTVHDDQLVMVSNGNDPYLVLRPDIAPHLETLRARSGNGPMPTTMAALAALFFLLGSGKRILALSAVRELKTADMTIVIFFGAVVCAPLVVSITGTDPQLANTEKRQLAAKPLYTLARTLAYPTEYTVYYEENFGLRKVYFRWNSLFMAKLLRTSPLPDKVIFGKDDWMFYMQPGALAKYEGLCDLPPARLEEVAQRLEVRRRWLAALGIDYVVMIPPEKSTIYPDKLPRRIRRFDEPSCLDLLLSHIAEHTEVKLVDVREELRDARAMGDVYYRNDTHWNPKGAWFGYCGLINTIRQVREGITPPRPFTSFDIVQETNEQGDLAQLMGLSDVFVRHTPLMISRDSLRAKNAPSGSYASSGFFKYAPVTKEIQGSKAPRLLMFRDSFTVYMIPTLSEHFSRSTYVWTPFFIPEVVLEERPDVVVHEVMELYLSDLLQDDLPLPALPLTPWSASQ